MRKHRYDRKREMEWCYRCQRALLLTINYSFRLSCVKVNTNQGSIVGQSTILSKQNGTCPTDSQKRLKVNAITERTKLKRGLVLFLLMVLAVLPSLVYAESEPNDTFATANPLDIGLSNAEVGNTLTDDDYDYYYFTAVAGRTYVFETTGSRVQV